MRREKEPSEVGVHLGNPIENRATTHCKVLAQTCDIGTLLIVSFVSPKRDGESETGCTFGEKCSSPHWKVEEQPNKQPKKNDNKSALPMLTDA